MCRLTRLLTGMQVWHFDHRGGDEGGLIRPTSVDCVAEALISIYGSLDTFTTKATSSQGVTPARRYVEGSIDYS